MIAASLKDGDEIVDLLLARGADVNAKSKLDTNDRPRHESSLIHVS